MSSRIDFEAVNGRGLTLRTFDDLDLASRWVDANAALHVGLRVERVHRVEHRSTVYRPGRPALQVIRGRR